MHTYFTLTNGGKSITAENEVLANYTSVFGKEALFSKIQLKYTVAGETKTVDIPIKHIKTLYLGENECEFSFVAEHTAEEQITVTAVSFVSESGKQINLADIEDITFEGEIFITAVAYASLNISGVNLSSTPENLFNKIFGVTNETIEGYIDGNGEKQPVDVAITTSANKITISTNLTANTNGNNLYVLCGGVEVCSLSNKSTLSNTIDVTSSNNALPFVGYANSVTSITGGTATLDDVLVRKIGRGIKGKEQIPVLFKYNDNGVRISEDGVYIATINKHSVTLFKRDNGKITAVSPLFSNFWGNIKDCFFLGSKLFVLKNTLLNDTLLVVDVETCETLADYNNITTFNMSAERVFVTDADIVLLCGKSGFYAYRASDMAQMFNVVATNACFHFDVLSQTLTMASEDSVRQFRFVDTVYYERTYSVDIDIPNITSISGRYGIAVITYENSYKIYNTSTKTVTSVENADGAKDIKAFVGGNLLTINKNETTEVVYLTSGEVIATIDNAEDIFVCSYGVLTNNSFYPFLTTENVFNVISQNDSGIYTIACLTPYFLNGTEIITFEGVVDV